MNRSDPVRKEIVDESMLEAVYPEMRRLAARLLARERESLTLQPTALVNESLMRLLHPTPMEFQNRAQFYSLASIMMRRILIDHARSSAKRGGDSFRLDAPDRDPALAVIEVDRALSDLEQFDPRMAKVVEMKFFAGFADDEIADLLGVSLRTVRRDWSFAKAWLKQHLAAPKEP